MPLLPSVPLAQVPLGLPLVAAWLLGWGFWARSDASAWVRVARGAVASPSLEAGAKVGPELGVSLAWATVAEDAAGGLLLDAHAAAASVSEPTNNIVSFLITDLY